MKVKVWPQASSILVYCTIWTRIIVLGYNKVSKRSEKHPGILSTTTICKIHPHFWISHTKETIHSKIASSTTVSCKNVKKMGQNTVFGYKKGSKSDLDIGSKSATLELYMNIFTTFFPRWSEHRKPEGVGKPLPPPCSF